MGGAGKSDQRIVLHQSTDIVKFSDNNIQEEQDRLFPNDPELQKVVESWGEYEEVDKSSAHLYETLMWARTKPKALKPFVSAKFCDFFLVLTMCSESIIKSMDLLISCGACWLAGPGSVQIWE
jgi:hypothetical protein